MAELSAVTACQPDGPILVGNKTRLLTASSRAEGLERSSEKEVQAAASARRLTVGQVSRSNQGIQGNKDTRGFQEPIRTSGNQWIANLSGLE